MRNGQAETGQIAAPGRLNWRNILVVVMSPAAAILALALYIGAQGVRAGDIVCFLVMWLCTGLAITAGYHRFFSHKTYQCSGIVQVFYLLFGAAACQTSALRWASDHRAHHRFADTDSDPYSIRKGFFWAHVGWTFFSVPEEYKFVGVADLAQRRLLRLQHRYYVPLGLLVGCGVPALIGLLFGRPLGGLVWGTLLRTVIVHHSTFLVNSAAHSFGTKPYLASTTARDSTIVAVMTLGEGYHNFHHAFPHDYRNGVFWHSWDPTKWWIYGLHLLGLAWDLKRIPENRLP